MIVFQAFLIPRAASYIAKTVSVKPNLINMDKKTLVTLNGLSDKNGNR